jgi:aminopeptidase 2
VYDAPPTASAKIDALMSLGATQSDELIKKTFTMLHDGSIKDQDVMYGFVSLSSNRKATRDVAKYFKDNYKAVSWGWQGVWRCRLGGLTRHGWCGSR